MAPPQVINVVNVMMDPVPSSLFYFRDPAAASSSDVDALSLVLGGSASSSSSSSSSEGVPTLILPAVGAGDGIPQLAVDLIIHAHAMKRIGYLHDADVPAVVGRAPYGRNEEKCSTSMEVYAAGHVAVIQQRAPADAGKALAAARRVAAWAAMVGFKRAVCLGDVDAGAAMRGAAAGPPLRRWPPEVRVDDRVAAVAPIADAELFGPLPPEERHLGPWPLVRELEDSGVSAFAIAAVNQRGDDPARAATALADVAVDAVGLPKPESWRAPPSWAHVLFS